jgi:hypothetical protein
MCKRDGNCLFGPNGKPHDDVSCCYNVKFWGLANEKSKSCSLIQYSAEDQYQTCFAEFPWMNING